MRRAIFLDRDGVINQNALECISSWEDFHFLPGSLEALNQLTRLNWPILLVTNQSIIGRGLMEESTLIQIHQKMLRVIREHRGRIDQIYVCPHAPQGGCLCRKPKPGMLLQAAQDFDLDLKACYLMGDNWTDLQAAQAVGVKSIWVGEKATLLPPKEASLPHPYWIAKNLSVATKIIISQLPPDKSGGL